MNLIDKNSIFCILVVFETCTIMNGYVAKIYCNHFRVFIGHVKWSRYTFYIAHIPAFLYASVKFLSA